ncbi:MAG: hypothetical protein NTX49_07665, partial [Chlamydiae bacterium]|nr:hypothetical protein [Chlamydiota bacterium]
GQELFVKGRMSTGYAVLMDIEGKTVNLKPMAKLKKITRISARRSCLTSRIPLENPLLNTMVFPSANTESSYFSKRELVCS